MLIDKVIATAAANSHARADKNLLGETTGQVSKQRQNK